jgi:sulfur relay (sulfurtransferase) DsrC/TusE family protein
LVVWRISVARNLGIRQHNVAWAKCLWLLLRFVLGQALDFKLSPSKRRRVLDILPFGEELGNDNTIRRIGGIRNDIQLQ